MPIRKKAALERRDQAGRLSFGPLPSRNRFSFLNSFGFLRSVGSAIPNVVNIPDQRCSCAAAVPPFKACKKGIDRSLLIRLIPEADLIVKPCSLAGKGVHSWLFDAACCVVEAGVTDDKAVGIIKALMTRDPSPATEIEDALEAARHARMLQSIFSPSKAQSAGRPQPDKSYSTVIAERALKATREEYEALKAALEDDQYPYCTFEVKYRDSEIYVFAADIPDWDEVPPDFLPSLGVLSRKDRRRANLREG